MDPTERELEAAPPVRVQAPQISVAMAPRIRLREALSEQVGAHESSCGSARTEGPAYDGGRLPVSWFRPYGQLVEFPTEQRAVERNGSLLIGRSQLDPRDRARRMRREFSQGDPPRPATTRTGRWSAILDQFADGDRGSGIGIGC